MFKLCTQKNVQIILHPTKCTDVVQLETYIINSHENGFFQVGIKIEKIIYMDNRLLDCKYKIIFKFKIKWRRLIDG
jgi:hypothetical protein